MSSPKNTIKGIVKEVGDIEFIGANRDFPKQRIIVFKPAFTDEFGTKRGQDDYFAFDVLGNSVETLNITERMLDQKVECDVYFTGSTFQKQDQTQGYAINARLAAIRVITQATRPSEKTNAPTDGEDDLPF